MINLPDLSELGTIIAVLHAVVACRCRRRYCSRGAAPFGAGYSLKRRKNWGNTFCQDNIGELCCLTKLLVWARFSSFLYHPPMFLITCSWNLSIADDLVWTGMAVNSWYKDFTQVMFLVRRCSSTDVSSYPTWVFPVKPGQSRPFDTFPVNILPRNCEVD